MSRDQRLGVKHKRQPYRESRAFDVSCRNHGGCPYCEGGRLRYRKVIRDDNKEIEKSLSVRVN